MKAILSVIAVVCMGFSMQGNGIKNHEVGFVNDVISVKKDAPVSIATIMKDILGNKRAYFMTGSLTILKAPKTGDVASALDLSFRNSLVIAYKGRDYIQANPKASRNDNNRKNEVRIYVHGDKQGKVNEKNIKLNWKSGSTGEIVGVLSNVNVLYQNDSILITGSFQKNGYTLGVNLAISREVKLI